jgi:hypothetical protein
LQPGSLIKDPAANAQRYKERGFKGDANPAYEQVARRKKRTSYF